MKPSETLPPRSWRLSTVVLEVRSPSYTAFANPLIADSRVRRSRDDRPVEHITKAAAEPVLAAIDIFVVAGEQTEGGCGLRSDPVLWTTPAIGGPPPRRTHTPHRVHKT